MKYRTVGKNKTRSHFRPLCKLGIRFSPILPVVILAFLMFLGQPCFVQAQSYINVGSYTGNGSDDRAINGVGFQPDVVIIKGQTGQVGVIKTSTMSGDLTKPLVGNTALTANYIQSLDTDGFTVGNDARVNSNGVIYHWVAFKAALGEMKVGSYTGTGIDNTLISGVGFNPSLIFIMSASTNAAVLRPNTSSNTFDFTNGAGFSGVGSHTSDGFNVRTDARVNASGTIYHYIAWTNVTGRQKFNGHWGDNTDNRDVTGLGFQPYYLIIKDVSSNQDTVFHSGSMGFSTDATMYYKNSANLDTDRIQALLTDGYQVGNDSDVNKNTSDFYATFAWGLSLPTRIDCNSGDWCIGPGDYCVNDEGGQNDFGSPSRLDITRFGVSSNLADRFYILTGFDDVPVAGGTAATLIDTDLNGNIDFAFVVTVNGGTTTVQLYGCDDTLSYGCGTATLAKTYASSDYCTAASAGPWDNDTFTEAQLPFSDLGGPGGSIVLTGLVSYAGGSSLTTPKDSIFGVGSQNYGDRVRYDTGNGNSQKIPGAATYSVSGIVYTDEGAASIGAGKTIRLLVNGVDRGTSTTDAAGGYIIFPTVSLAAGNIVLVYIDNDPTYQGTAVTILKGIQIVDLDVYAGRVITRHDNAGTLTNTNLSTAKGASSDSDILYSVSGGALTVTGTNTVLYLPTGYSFSPGGNVTTPNLKSLGTFGGGSGAIGVNGTLTVAGGTFTATSGTMSVSGNFNHSAGTFTHNSGSVVLNGTNQTIYGSNAFYNLAKTATADTLTVQAGTTQSVSGTATLLGTSGEGTYLSLRSSVPGTPWFFNVNAGATKNINYVDVQDSNASGSDGSQKPIGPVNFIDYGNNVDWFAVTSVDLVAFSAKGGGSTVLVTWKTGQELENLGFHLYRASSLGGPYTRITEKVIAGMTFSSMGRAYSFVDSDVVRGQIYYYRLEDIDIFGKKTMHGPVCVDWDGDGMPDDWEAAHGTNPGVPDGHLDSDGNGLTNIEEYERGGKAPEVSVVAEPQTLGKGVEVISSDKEGITLELRTEAFEAERVEAGGVTYQRLRVPEYIHGYTSEVGKPELPVKGVILDVPDGKTARVWVEGTESVVHPGYRVYPVTEKMVSYEAGTERVVETFSIDEGAYGSSGFYPGEVAQTGESYTFRGQEKRQLLFYPLQFNPGTGELVQYSRIRVRVAYEGSGAVAFAKSMAPAPAVNPMAKALAWAPPSLTTPAYKVKVEEEGMYRLSRGWLESRGVDVSAMSVSQVRMYNLGQEVAVGVYDQDGDDLFDAEDYIEFYAQKAPSPQSKYARHSVYWLTTSGGSGAALRMGSIDGSPGSGSLVATHTFTAHEEINDIYLKFVPGDDTVERWYNSSFVYGSGMTGTPTPEDVDFALGVPGLGGSLRGTLKISMCGFTDMEHDVEVLVNGLPVGRYRWSGITFSDEALSGAAVDLMDGNNTVTLKCHSGTDPDFPDGVLVDWMEVTYPRRFEAGNNQLKFSHATGSRYQVAGFSGDSILAYDVTSPQDAKKVTNGVVTGSGVYTLEMEPRGGSGERSYLVLGPGAVKTPAAIVQDRVSDLFSTANGADYILITHRDLGWDGSGTPHPWLDGPSSMVSLRQGQGMRVKVVDVEDIYDEFGYGVVSPQAIRDFLMYAYESWVKPAPKYVLLVGDGTYDARDRFGLGTVNFLPTYLTFTSHMGETGADEWYGRVSGDDLVPDLYVGRLPAATADQASTMVGKIVGYERALNTRTWERNVLLVADNATEPYEEAFEGMNEDAAGYIPAAMGVPFRGYLGDYGDASELTSAITQRIDNEGALVVNYSGHGSVQVWANETILTNEGIEGLGNGEKLPFFVGMTCLTGYFLEPEGFEYPSMAEVLLRSAGKGGVAALMSTGRTGTSGQQVLDRALFEGIFPKDLRVVGDAVSYAKQQLLANGSVYQDESVTFLLFGDPATRLKVTLPTMPRGVVVQAVAEGISLSWEGATDCDGNGVAGYNVYRSSTPGSNYTKVNQGLIKATSFVEENLLSGVWYYVVKSVDGYGVESAASAEVSVAVATRSVGEGSSGGGGGGGGCFIGTLAN